MVWGFLPQVLGIDIDILRGLYVSPHLGRSH